jgi:translation initiation factor 1
MSKNALDSRLVYSTDPAQNKKCDKCKELLAACTCQKELPFSKAKFVAYLRIEKSGRGGKIVTAIYELPKVESFLKELTTELKKKCGSGGTYLMDQKEGVIEIQGDKKEVIRNILEKKRYQDERVGAYRK